MACASCGRPCKGHQCNDCARDARWEDAVEDLTYSDSGDDEGDEDDVPSESWYETGKTTKETLPDPETRLDEEGRFVASGERPSAGGDA